MCYVSLVFKYRSLWSQARCTGAASFGGACARAGGGREAGFGRAGARRSIFAFQYHPTSHQGEYKVGAGDRGSGPRAKTR